MRTEYRKHHQVKKPQSKPRHCWCNTGEGTVRWNWERSTLPLQIQIISTESKLPLLVSCSWPKTTFWFQPVGGFSLAVSEFPVHQLLVFQQRELRADKETSVEVRKAEHLEQGGHRRQCRILLSIISFRLERSRETEEKIIRKENLSEGKCQTKRDKIVASGVTGVWVLLKTRSK